MTQLQRLPDELEQVLRSSGLPWHVEMGGLHRKVFVGRRLACILPKNHRKFDQLPGSGVRKLVAQVRRVIRETTDGR